MEGVIGKAPQFKTKRGQKPFRSKVFERNLNKLKLDKEEAIDSSIKKRKSTI